MKFLSPDKLEWGKNLKARDISGIVVLGDVQGSIGQETVGDLSLRWGAVRSTQSELAQLTWRSQLTDFKGRKNEFDKLVAWAQSDQTLVLAQFVTGPGGIGKTRLAAEVARFLREEGGAAGFASLKSPNCYYTKAKGTLILIDYPEEHRDGVRSLLEGLGRLEPESPIRILFLSRKGWDVWQDEINRVNDVVDCFEYPVLPLSPMEEDDAHEAFLSARSKLEGAYQRSPSVVDREQFRTWFAQDPEHRKILFVAAAALYTILVPDRNILSVNHLELIGALVERELARLRDESTSAGLKAECLPRLAAFAILSKGLSQAAIRDLAERTDLDLGFPPATSVVDMVNETGRMDGDTFPAPEPDILAASFLVQVFAANSSKAAEWLWAGIEGEPQGGIERLGRLTYDAEELLRLPAAGLPRISDWLEASVKGDPSRCAVLDGPLRDSKLPLNLANTAFTVRKTLLEQAANGEERADHLNSLSVDLARIGSLDEALEAILEAVDIIRGLAKSRPEVFRTNLAVTLNNLSNRFNALGRREEALDAIEEAVDIRRGLAESRPEDFRPDLANSLNGLSGVLNVLGRPEDAFKASEEAVDIYQNLASARPEAFHPDLAMSLTNLSNRLSALGSREATLDAIQRAVDIHRDLAEARPEAFRSDLATSVNNLPSHLSDLGKHEAALDAIQESVDIRRGLAEARPEAFHNYLARSLGLRGDVLKELGRMDEARASFAEALEIIALLAERYPDGPPGETQEILLNDMKKLDDEADN